MHRRFALSILILSFALGCARGRPAPHDANEPATARDVPAADSVTEGGPGEWTLSPVARIEYPAINECSGIVWLGGAFWANNDSGDGPVLYRSAALDFAQAESLPVPGAKAVDWEDITALGGDILACDIGDNGRKRDDLTLYRVRYHGGAFPLELVAVYPIRYPDQRHDAEAAAVIDGVLHIVSKQRGESKTGVYRFDTLLDEKALPPGEENIGRLVATLDLLDGEQVTGADYDSLTGTVALLTYQRILRYPKERFSGRPAASVGIWAGQCEGVCFQGDRLVVTNEQRDVYVIGRFAARDLASPH